MIMIGLGSGQLRESLIRRDDQIFHCVMSHSCESAACYNKANISCIQASLTRPERERARKKGAVQMGDALKWWAWKPHRAAPGIFGQSELSGSWLSLPVGLALIDWRYLNQWCCSFGAVSSWIQVCFPDSLLLIMNAPS